MNKTAIAIVLGLLLLGTVPASAQEITDNFYVTVGSGIVLEGGGSGYDNGTWYVYPSNWINQWFYDHPFDDTRGKIVTIEFDWEAYDPTCTTDITVAFNWSTPAWTDLGHGDELPPLPASVGENENLYIMRTVLLDVCDTITDKRHVSWDFIIWAYNPEWVSIDVMGCNFIITNGVIVHECAVGTEESSWGTIKMIDHQ
jgi:hypothetical protein